NLWGIINIMYPDFPGLKDPMSGAELMRDPQIARNPKMQKFWQFYNGKLVEYIKTFASKHGVHVTDDAENPGNFYVSKDQVVVPSQGMTVDRMMQLMETDDPTEANRQELTQLMAVMDEQEREIGKILGYPYEAPLLGESRTGISF